jgi:pyruvate/2-oxoglutarate dehydrogenase complex dihydrolipoamide dehydrogenase (E3) component
MNDYDVIVISGECSYRACIPSKTVMLPGEAVHGARKSAAKAEFDELIRQQMPIIDRRFEIEFLDAGIEALRLIT